VLFFKLIVKLPISYPFPPIASGLEKYLKHTPDLHHKFLEQIGWMVFSETPCSVADSLSNVSGKKYLVSNIFDFDEENWPLLQLLFLPVT